MGCFIHFTKWVETLNKFLFLAVCYVIYDIRSSSCKEEFFKKTQNPTYGTYENICKHVTVTNLERI